MQTRNVWWLRPHVRGSSYGQDHEESKNRCILLRSQVQNNLRNGQITTSINDVNDVNWSKIYGYLPRTDRNRSYGYEGRPNEIKRARLREKEKGWRREKEKRRRRVKEKEGRRRECFTWRRKTKNFEKEASWRIESSR